MSLLRYTAAYLPEDAVNGTSVTATTSTSWNAQAAVTTSSSTSWTVTSTLSTARSTLWNVAKSVSAASSTSWNALASIAAERSTLWNVASSAVTPIALRAAGTPTAATAVVTAINPAVPTGATTGDLSVLTVWAKPFGTTITTPSGWTLIDEHTNGTTAAGTDTGSTKVAVYVKESAAVGAIGNLTLGGSPNSVGAVINTYSKDPTLSWDVSAFTQGFDATNAANYSATGDAGIDVASGDWVLASTAVCGDVGTLSAFAIGDMSGATLDTYVSRQNSATTTGTDSRGVVGDVPVSSGSSTAAPTFTYTNASSTSGTTVWLRLRQAVGTTAVSSAISTTWNVVGRISSSASTLWNVLQNLTPVSTARSTLWTVRAQVAASKSSPWNVRQAISAARSSLWTVRSVVSPAVRSTSWNALASIAQARSTSWNTLGNLLSVSKAISTTWKVVGRISAPRSTTWNTRAYIAANRSTTWTVRSAVAAAVRSTSWRVLTTISVARGTSWSVFRQVATSRSTLWHSRALVARSASSLWHLVGSTSQTFSTAWHVFWGIETPVIKKPRARLTMAQGKAKITRDSTSSASIQ